MFKIFWTIHFVAIGLFCKVIHGRELQRNLTTADNHFSMVYKLQQDTIQNLVINFFCIFQLASINLLSCHYQIKQRVDFSNGRALDIIRQTAK